MLKVWKISFDILLPIDEHPCGARIRSFAAVDAATAMTALEALYSVRCDGRFMRIHRVECLGEAVARAGR
jgi:hypothetical protein